MSLSLNSIKVTKPESGFKPNLVVFGVGGAGGNAVNNMVRSELNGVKFFAINTDAQALEYSLAENKIQIGRDITGGLGAGAVPELGKKAVEESIEEIKEALRGTHMLFITAGMGGGTGTGAAPIIAEIAKSMGILTIGVVTKPFDFEGKSRQKIADTGLVELRKYVDTLIVIPNQNLFRVVNERTSFVDAFKIADEVLYSGVKCITDLITMPGLVNLDFADVKTIMQNMGRAMMSSGEAAGEDRAIKAAEMAIINPLLDTSSIDGAKGVLINITGGSDMTLFEVNDAVEAIRSNLDEHSNIIFGAIFNEKYDGIIRVSVVATGVGDDAEQDGVYQLKEISVPLSKSVMEKQPAVAVQPPKPKFNNMPKEDMGIAAKKTQYTKVLDEQTAEDLFEEDDSIEEFSISTNYHSESQWDASEEPVQENKNTNGIRAKKLDTEDLEDILVIDDYIVNANEPSRKVLINKIYKKTGISHNEVSEEKSTPPVNGKKKGISGMLNNILFGSEE